MLRTDDAGSGGALMELNFACKRFPIDQILRCAFGLSGTEFTTLRTLLKKGDATVEELAETLGKDRTTIQRSISPLVQKGLVQRRQYNLEGGGYQYSYSPKDKAWIKAEIQKHFERFSELVKSEVEKW